MTRTTRPESGDTTLNEDGTVTLWDLFRQEWQVGTNPSDRVLSTLSAFERSKIMLYLASPAKEEK